MSYRNANSALPYELLCAVQEYIDGEYIYIPRKEDKKQVWGAKTGTREKLRTRNREIINRYTAGSPVAKLAEEYFLSVKAVYKIISAAKNG